MENECCACDCSRCRSSSLPWRRSVKRRIDRTAEEGQGGHVQAVDGLARVEVGNECCALREAISTKQGAINELQLELEEERNASSTAASEAMLMILRLQREKAEVQMEARQFRRFADEKMAHERQEIVALEDAFFRCDQAVRALSFEVQAYRHRFTSYGIDPDTKVQEGVEILDDDHDGSGNEATVANDKPVHDHDYPACEYPPLKCSVRDADSSDELIDLDKYAHTPRARGHLHRMERTSGSGRLDVLEKGVLVGRHASAGSFLGRDSVQDHGSSKLRRFDERSPTVYTNDRAYGDRTGTPRDTVFGASFGVEGPDHMKKLYIMRLHAIEADRALLKQEIVSMAQNLNLCKGAAQPSFVQERRRPAKKSCLSFWPFFKWIASFIFWKRKACRSKYASGLSYHAAGLLSLLDKSPRTRGFPHHDQDGRTPMPVHVDHD